LTYIKVAFVLSRFDFGLTATTYPVGSAMLFSASHVFTRVSTFNSAVAIQHGAIASAAFNQLYYRLPDTRYAIYGITSFELPSSGTCSTLQVNATLNSIDTFTITTPNSSPAQFFFAADIFTVNVDQLCRTSGIPFSTQVNTVGKKSYFTVPTQSLQQYILEDVSAPSSVPISPISPALSYILNYYGAANGNNDTILFKAEIPFTGLTVGAPLKFEFGFYDNQPSIGTLATAKMILNKVYNIKLEVNGFVLYETAYTALAAGTNAVIGILRGLNANTVTANAVITISYVRDSVTSLDQSFYTYVRLFQYTAAYNPDTGCCPAFCPAQTGLNVQIDPPSCVSCNTNAGLVYNPNAGSCTCQTGFYLDPTKTFQCYSCSALYCSVCVATNPANCTTCATGAVRDNITATCSCSTGFFVNLTTCQQCPYQCQSCSAPTAACITCVDPLHRDISQNCKCITGFFDGGNVNCTACSQTCLTCTNATACTSCDASKFRNLTGGLCGCFVGYYEFYHTDLSRTCELCNPECLTCSTSPALCTSCDPKKGRVSGVDAAGRQTCLCPPGFYSNPDGSCAQSNCNADPFCAECEQGLKLCIRCLSSRFRVIKLPEAICVCMDGYYADANNTCVPCKSGCGLCKSATNCTACVALALGSNDGSCACPNATYFTVSTDGVRYCAACGANCLQCLDATTCSTCKPTYVKTADNKCVCAARSFVAANGTCQPCVTGCDICSSATVCSSCITPLLLQGSVCQVTCNDGSTAIGSVCQGCPAGCLKCTQNLICYYCADNFYMYKGNCYSVCPAGTIGDNSSGNWACNPCNSPCKTCMNHPSFCTSCLNGMGYLQTSAVQQSCVLSCVDGTYAEAGVCQVCDFRCATCLGSATNCISCPAGQVLYQGGCWAQCPAISLQRVGQNASCTDACPDGYYKVSATECAACAIECTTCDGGPKNCTSCLHGSVSTSGTCSVTCKENEFSFQGFCVACSASCYGCANNPQNCLSCASGYVKTGSICQKGCLSYQFFDQGQNKCIACAASCATCSSYSYCSTCKNAAITPRGGVCSECPYPCATCDGSGACTSCLSGFYYFQGACQTSCPAGASPLNGVCQCASGIVSLGQCVTSCGSGFTSIAGACQPCNSNCAECAGDVNACTRCLAGATLDSQSRRCVSAAQCPYGQDLSAGVCASICDSGFYYYEGICIYGGCFTGYVPNSYGGCVRQSQAASGPSCASNQYIQDNSCVGTCASKFYPDSTSRQCLPCSANCETCFSSSFCIICTTGYAMVNGVCVKSTSCPANQYQYNGQCLSQCPVGTYVVGSTCNRSCPDGNYYLSQMCYISCPQLRTNEACVQQCPAGTSNNNGVCQ
jgi:hypothetical protein